MTDPKARTFSSDFKRFFLRGLAVLLPSVLTLWLLVKAYQFIDDTIAEPVNRGVRLGIVQLTPHWSVLGRQFEPTPEEIEGAFDTTLMETRVIPDRAVLQGGLRRDKVETWWAERWYMDLIGLAIAIIAVYVAGRLLGGYFGRTIYRRLERLLTRLPVFKQVYPSVKQLVDFFFSDDKPMKFNRVVVVQYPRQGIWSLGFLTGESMRAVAERTGDGVTVFVPSSPTPFMGYTMTVPRKDVVEVDVSVDEALKYLVSGGVLMPPNQVVAPGQILGTGLSPKPDHQPWPLPESSLPPASTTHAQPHV